LDIGIFLVVALERGPFGGSRSIAEGSGAGRSAAGGPRCGPEHLKHEKV
jgi:hypothetical protein